MAGSDSSSDSHDFFGPGGPFFGSSSKMMKPGFGDYPGEFQSPESLPNTTSRCFGNFELLDKTIITEPIWNVHLGIRPPPPPPPPTPTDADDDDDTHDEHADIIQDDAEGGDGSGSTTATSSSPSSSSTGCRHPRPPPPLQPIIPPPFKFTRLVWTIEPNPNETDTNTYIYSYPPHILKATLIKDYSTNSNTITFQPTIWRHRSHRHHYDYFTAGFTGEAGVLIRLPRTKTLTAISYYSLYTPGSDRIQIMDSNGFPGLATIQVNTSSHYTNLSPGQGVSVNIHSGGGVGSSSNGEGGTINDGMNLPADSAATAAAAAASDFSNNKGLSLLASGSGILVQADLTNVDLVRFQNVVNSKLELKFQQIQRGFMLSGYTTTTNNNNMVYLEGPLAKAQQPVVATDNVQVQIYDPTGQYECYNPIDKIADCTSLMSGPAINKMLEVFPCTTLPISVDDVLFCNTDFLIQLALERNHPPEYYFDIQSGYGCTLEGMMEDQFLIPPEEEDHSSAGSWTTSSGGIIIVKIVITTTIVVSFILFVG